MFINDQFNFKFNLTDINWIQLPQEEKIKKSINLDCIEVLFNPALKKEVCIYYLGELANSTLKDYFDYFSYMKTRKNDVLTKEIININSNFESLKLKYVNSNGQKFIDYYFIINKRGEMGKVQILVTNEVEDDNILKEVVRSWKHI